MFEHGLNVGGSAAFVAVEIVGAAAVENVREVQDLHYWWRQEGGD